MAVVIRFVDVELYLKGFGSSGFVWTQTKASALRFPTAGAARRFESSCRSLSVKGVDRRLWSADEVFFSQAEPRGSSGKRKP